MTGSDELVLTPEGRKILRVRQSSDIFAKIPVGDELGGCKHG
jgi:hypothetical protein